MHRHIFAHVSGGLHRVSVRYERKTYRRRRQEMKGSIHERVRARVRLSGGDVGPQYVNRPLSEEYREGQAPSKYYKPSVYRTLENAMRHGEGPCLASTDEYARLHLLTKSMNQSIY